jgi:flagellar motor protein MotB
MSDNSRPRMIFGAVVWLAVIGVAVLGYRYWWAPRQERVEKEAAKAEHQATIDKTGSDSKYTSVVRFAGDGFSGYAPIRSQTFKDECGKYGVRIDYKDDGANYVQRLRDLADGNVDMGVFTIDALIKTSADMKDFPATIVGIVDESNGADAILAAGKKFPNIDAMNSPETKIVCVQNSPSETLARVIMTHFNLDKLSSSPFEFEDSIDAVYKKYQKSKPEDNRVFALWEPYVARVRDNPDYHTLVDSSKFRGYFVDVIVVRRGFLLKNEPIVENVVKSYLSTLFSHRAGMTDLVVADAQALGEPLKKEQAERLVKSIWWKNTQETFGHFGFVRGNVQNLEDICRNITDVLVKTGAISSDPTNGKPSMWYYDGIMRKLFDSSWHPGFGSEGVREEHKLLALKEEEWASLKPVGTLRVSRLVFPRGSFKISDGSEAILQELAEKMKNWPQYYLVVKGHASSSGDLEANLKLATERANSAVEWLVSRGVDRNRIRAESAKPNGSTTVAFVVGELPY